MDINNADKAGFERRNSDRAKMQKQKKRIRIQQNIITTLCLACMIFSVGWSVYAAETQSVAVDKSTSSVSKKDDSSKSEKIKKKDDSSSKKDESSKAAEESSSQAEESSSKTDGSSLVPGEDSSQPREKIIKSREIVDKKDDLSDALFIGDSRTVGLRNSSNKPKATFYCAVGLHIDTVLTSTDVSLENGKTGSVVSALKAKKFKRIYLNFGTNELGWPNRDIFKEKYAQVVKTVKKLQPGAVIYAESVLPVTASRDAKGDSVNNTNVKAFNEIIKQVADENGINYLDCSPAVADARGLLPENASTDGVHMIAEYCLYWQNFIINNT